jgi:hypothetical protein
MKYKSLAFMLILLLANLKSLPQDNTIAEYFNGMTSVIGYLEKILNASDQLARSEDKKKYLRLIKEIDSDIDGIILSKIELQHHLANNPASFSAELNNISLSIDKLQRTIKKSGTLARQVNVDVTELASSLGVDIQQKKLFMNDLRNLSSEELQKKKPWVQKTLQKGLDLLKEAKGKISKIRRNLEK